MPEALMSKASRVEACAISGWEAESHSFFGDPKHVAAKLAAANLGVGRRQFYEVVEGDRSAMIYEFEHKAGDIYGVRVATVDSAVAEEFNNNIRKVISQNKGTSCVGAAVKALPGYKNLKFTFVAEEEFSGTQTLASAVASESGEHQLSSEKLTFVTTTVHVLC